MEQGHILSLPQAFALDSAVNQRKSAPLEETIVELYATMRTSLLGYAFQMLGTSGEAEDLVQLAFLKLFDQLKRNAEIQNLRSWLYRVIHNLAIDQVRRRGIQDSAIAEWAWQRNLEDAPFSAENHLIQKQRIANSLEALNERERHCLMLRAEGLSYQEIGDVLSISAKSVSVYLARGLKKFESRNAQSA
jgi:RNA polymerase sigma-70 factor (ECF subfamily)